MLLWLSSNNSCPEGTGPEVPWPTARVLMVMYSPLPPEVGCGSIECLPRYSPPPPRGCVACSLFPNQPYPGLHLRYKKCTKSIRIRSGACRCRSCTYAGVTAVLPMQPCSQARPGTPSRDAEPSITSNGPRTASPTHVVRVPAATVATRYVSPAQQAVSSPSVNLHPSDNSMINLEGFIVLFLAFS